MTVAIFFTAVSSARPIERTESKLRSGASGGFGAGSAGFGFAFLEAAFFFCLGAADWAAFPVNSVWLIVKATLIPTHKSHKSRFIATVFLVQNRLRRPILPRVPL